jgi:type I restriction enzyme S subunit
MTNVLHGYSEYKYSGLLWLGIIPSHWSCFPHRKIFEEIRDQGHEKEKLLSVTIQRGVIRQAELLANGSKKDSSNLDKSKYKLVKPDDIVYNKMRAWQGAIGASKDHGIVSPAYIVHHLRGDENPTYFHYLFRTPAFAGEAERWSYGITSDQWSLRPEHFKLIYSCVPPRDEQDAIVRFLKSVDRRIRYFIRNRRRLIKLLTEQKQAIINKYVTRGIDPNVALKSSGIAWLGDIPAHWQTIPLKRCSSLVRDGTHLPPPRTPVGIPLLSVRNIVNGKFVRRDDDSFISQPDYQLLCKSFIPQAGDVLLAIVGATLGKVAIIPEMEPFHIQRSLAILRPKPGILDNEFLSFFLQSQRFQDLLWQTVAFSAQPGIYLGTIAATPTTVPPFDEQRRIVDLIKDELLPVSASISKAEREIDLIREYRTSMIAEVVTGKVDVRHLAPPPKTEDDKVPLEELEPPEDEVVGLGDDKVGEEMTYADD